MLLAAIVATSSVAFGSYLPIAPEVIRLSEPSSMLIEHPDHPGRMVRADVETQVVINARIVDAASIEGTRVSNFDISVLTRLNYEATPIVRRPLTILGGCESKTIDWDLTKQVEVMRGPVSAMWGSDVHNGVLNITRKAEKEMGIEDVIDFNRNLRDNGWNRYNLGYKFKNLYADTQLFQVTRIEGEKEPRNDLIGSMSYLAGAYLIPDKVVEQFEEDGPNVTPYVNELGGVLFTPTYAEKYQVGGLWMPRAPLASNYRFNYTAPGTSNPQEYLRHCARTYGQNRIQNWITRSELPLTSVNAIMNSMAARGSSMNRLGFPGNPQSSDMPLCGSTVIVPVGSVWLPSERGYQGMSNFSRVRYLLPSGVASTSPEPRLFQEEMRTHCVSMGLKEPDPSVAYYPYSSPDVVLTELMKIADASRIRGPWDQARTWIYTDKATFADINKRLIPGVTEGQFVNGLWDVARLGGLSKEDLANPALFDPDLLAAATARDDSFGWFATHMSNHFPKETRSWMERNYSKLASLVADDRQDIEKRHPSRLLRLMLAARNTESRLGALGSLARLGENGSALKDSIGDLRASLYSDDTKEVEMALAISRMYQTSRPKEALQYLAQMGKTAEIKSKAAALL